MVDEKEASSFLKVGFSETCQERMPYVSSGDVNRLLIRILSKKRGEMTPCDLNRLYHFSKWWHASSTGDIEKIKKRRRRRREKARERWATTTAKQRGNELNKTLDVLRSRLSDNEKKPTAKIIWQTK